jgi:hypothetical protein
MDKDKPEKPTEQKPATKQDAAVQDDDELRIQHVLDPKTGKKTAFKVRTISKPKQKREE